MKDRIFTNNLRTIKRNIPRFLSLMVMSILGVFVFVGLLSTSPDMIKTLDCYLDEHKVYDIRILSNLGFSGEDVESLKGLEKIEQVELSYQKDILCSWEKEEQVIEFVSLPKKVNTVTLLEGEYPKEAREVLVEEAFVSITGLGIGDSFCMGEERVTITGTVESPLYYNSVSISQSRGTTDVGTGKVIYYAYGVEELFEEVLKMTRFTDCYLTVKGAEDFTTSEEAYQELVDEQTEEIRSLDKPSFMGMEPTWYIQDRTDYITYSDYIDDSNSIANLSKIFPVVFFVVAVLVSLISMNRMVEDDRLEIGTLKSLGFSNGTIMRKYASFSFFATFLGGCLGAALGMVVIPQIIYSIYGLLFDLPGLVMMFPVKVVVLGLVIMLLCVCGTSLLTARVELKEKPSVLMRPRAPKSGRRVFLERLPFLWKKLKFSRKVTIRNIFRYKKRVFATVFGIAGCTALMLIGFGVRDSVKEIASEQFGSIFVYDGTVFLADGSHLEETLDFPEITDYVPLYKSSMTASERNLNLLVVEDEKALHKMGNFVDHTSKEEVHLETGKVLINEKLAELNDLEVGDDIVLVNADKEEMRFLIGGIFDNYLEHYVIADKATYERYKSFMPNQACIFTENLSGEKKEAFRKELLKKDEILYLAMQEDMVESANNMLNSLNKVVIILIVLAALLAFVVLYNLSNINITERRREIATLKVLGFYNNEVDSYITRENILLTLLGIVLGLLAGKYLTHAVVTTVEIERARFMNWIHVPSYVFSGILSAGFTVIVNFITHFKLKNIDMIDSLKSVE